MSEKRVVFTLCSNNYLAQALTVGKSCLKHNKDVDFVVGLVDRRHPDIDYDSFGPIIFHFCEEIGFPQVAGMIPRYNIVELNTSVKALYFEFLLARYDKVIYLDPDIIVYDSFADLFNLMDEHDVLLTPHFVTLEDEFGRRWQRIVNNVGIFNFGFVAMKSTDNTTRLLKWWQQKLEFDCFMMVHSGLFVDQIWGNFFPVFFEKIFVIRDPAYNMAFWNFGERKAELKDGLFFVNGRRLKFFHFSSYKLSQPEIISRSTDITFEQRPDVVPIFEGYRKALQENGHNKYSKLQVLLPCRSDKVGPYKMLGLRIRVHGTRLLDKAVKVFFRA
jgi:hypothetical protein